MHVSGADRPNELSTFDYADGEHHKHRALRPVDSNCDCPLLFARVPIVRKEIRIAIEHVLDLVDGDAVLLALI
jgi:hypothetical protein